MDAIGPLDVENDPRFPNGPWTGFFLQCWLPGRHRMVIDFTFDRGQLQATGTDTVGPFTFDGDYDLANGECHWVKQYVGRHEVTYTGVNEGQGIWGVWEIRQFGGFYTDRGVFHIWPQGMAPTKEAEATVEAYLSHVRSSWLSTFLRLAVPSALILGTTLVIRHLVDLWVRAGMPL